MLFLAYSTWRYAWNARDLKVIYNELGRSRRLAADLEKSQNETREKGFFLNSISHDLRTPLNGLMLQAGLAEVALESEDSETLRRALQEIKTTAQTTGRMLDSLLSYAQVASSDSNGNGAAALPLCELVDAILEQHRAAAAQKGLYLCSEIPKTLVIQTHRAKLERILGNLVDNAIKFTDTGGVRLEADNNGKALELHVFDTGIGIAPADRERLFDEFYQVGNANRDHRKGFGLGLAIARRLATQLGGDVHVESAPGSGSRFTVLLPDAIVPPARSPERADRVLATAR
jgi:two-component system, sensor histidine kinase